MESRVMEWANGSWLVSRFKQTESQQPCTKWSPRAWNGNWRVSCFNQRESQAPQSNHVPLNLSQTMEDPDWGGLASVCISAGDSGCGWHCTVNYDTPNSVCQTVFFSFYSFASQTFPPSAAYVDLYTTDYKRSMIQQLKTELCNS